MSASLCERARLLHSFFRMWWHLPLRVSPLQATLVIPSSSTRHIGCAAGLDDACGGHAPVAASLTSAGGAASAASSPSPSSTGVPVAPPELVAIIGKVLPGCAVCEGIHAEGPIVADYGGLPISERVRDRRRMNGSRAQRDTPLPPPHDVLRAGVTRAADNAIGSISRSTRRHAGSAHHDHQPQCGRQRCAWGARRRPAMFSSTAVDVRHRRVTPTASET